MYHQLHLVAIVLGYILVAALFASLEIAPCRSSISGTRQDRHLVVMNPDSSEFMN